jgi:FOG: TPR repeat, SEL1 subfamily
MKKMYIVCLLLLMAVGAARADFNDGVVAYLMGDYETAYNTMISLAKTEDGNPYPQYYLGMMYLRGQGVEKNEAEAGKWFIKAAENRLPQAQYKLAELYSQGNGLPRDYESAFIWYSVGAAHEHKLSKNALENAKTKLSGSELAEAEKMISIYIEKFGPKKGDDSKQEEAAQSISSQPPPE